MGHGRRTAADLMAQSRARAVPDGWELSRNTAGWWIGSRRRGLTQAEIGAGCTRGVISHESREHALVLIEEQEALSARGRL